MFMKMNKITPNFVLDVLREMHAEVQIWHLNLTIQSAGSTGYEEEKQHQQAHS